MKKLFSAIVLAATAAIMGGCVVAPQQPVFLAPGALSAGSGRVGVVMTALPKVDTSFPGASCLLCVMFASGANSTLSTHTRTLTAEDLPKIKSDLAEALRRKGVDAVLIEEDLALDTLPSNDAKGPLIARRNHISLQQKYKVDRLVVVNITGLGIWRYYSAYIPTSDPKGIFIGVAYMVNLKDNTYDWYLPININRAADGNWDEPPKFPGLTNAYFQAIETGKDAILGPFAK
jgi:hypothetical protein